MRLPRKGPTTNSSMAAAMKQPVIQNSPVKYQAAQQRFVPMPTNYDSVARAQIGAINAKANVANAIVNVVDKFARAAEEADLRNQQAEYITQSTNLESFVAGAYTNQMLREDLSDARSDGSFNYMHSEAETVAEINGFIKSQDQSSHITDPVLKARLAAHRQGQIDQISQKLAMMALGKETDRVTSNAINAANEVWDESQLKEWDENYFGHGHIDDETEAKLRLQMQDQIDARKFSDSLTGTTVDIIMSEDGITQELIDAEVDPKKRNQMIEMRRQKVRALQAEAVSNFDNIDNINDLEEHRDIAVLTETLPQSEADVHFDKAAFRIIKAEVFDGIHDSNGSMKLSSQEFGDRLNTLNDYVAEGRLGQENSVTISKLLVKELSAKKNAEYSSRGMAAGSSAEIYKELAEMDQPGYNFEEKWGVARDSLQGQMIYDALWGEAKAVDQNISKLESDEVKRNALIESIPGGITVPGQTITTRDSNGKVVKNDRKDWIETKFQNERDAYLEANRPSGGTPEERALAEKKLMDEFERKFISEQGYVPVETENRLLTDWNDKSGSEADQVRRQLAVLGSLLQMNEDYGFKLLAGGADAISNPALKTLFEAAVELQSDLKMMDNPEQIRKAIETTVEKMRTPMGNSEQAKSFRQSEISQTLGSDLRSFEDKGPIHEEIEKMWPEYGEIRDNPDALKIVYDSLRRHMDSKLVSHNGASVVALQYAIGVVVDQYQWIEDDYGKRLIRGVPNIDPEVLEMNLREYSQTTEEEAALGYRVKEPIPEGSYVIAMPIKGGEDGLVIKPNGEVYVRELVHIDRPDTLVENGSSVVTVGRNNNGPQTQERLDLQSRLQTQAADRARLEQEKKEREARVAAAKAAHLERVERQAQGDFASAETDIHGDPNQSIRVPTAEDAWISRTIGETRMSGDPIDAEIADEMESEFTYFLQTNGGDYEELAKKFARIRANIRRVRGRSAKPMESGASDMEEALPEDIWATGA